MKSFEGQLVEIFKQLENVKTLQKYGNAFPMYGTGYVIYSQLGYLLKKICLKRPGIINVLCKQAMTDWINKWSYIV
jgi:hypothetical protein